MYEELKKRAYSLLEDYDKSRRKRIEKLVSICMKIGKTQNVNLDLLEISAILHDVDRTREKHHNIKDSADTAEKFLVQNWMEGKDAKKVREIILCQCWENMSENSSPSLESKIFFDAKTILMMEDMALNTSEDTNMKKSIKSLLRDYNKMFFESSRKMAKKDYETLNEFLESFEEYFSQI